MLNANVSMLVIHQNLHAPAIWPGLFLSVHFVLFVSAMYEENLGVHKCERYNYFRRYLKMTSISATEARNNLYNLISEVNSSSEPITITNKRGKNAVLISEDDWNALQETLYLNSIPGMADSIINADFTDAKEYDPDEEW